MPQLILEDLNLAAAERRLCVAALEQGGNIVSAAQLLGITRHAMKRRIVKLRIAWPRPAPQISAASPSISPSA
ncbi:helix-turn-helix domain-containing protein [Nannocystis exedens]|uniref:helix-turn-helix domain-containing protein n=1 Tax=Nannocystis exedens TaxID=54 RepID=UPI001160D64A|nr:helix-turn-helix domain-containing protein [Nannocystis exedens]